MVKSQTSDNFDDDSHASRRDKKIIDRDKPSDNRKSVGLIAKLGTQASGVKKRLPKRNAKRP